MAKPNLSVTSVTIGTSMPLQLADFYSRLLEWPVSVRERPAPGEPANAGWAQVRPPEGKSGPTLNFEFERCFRRPVWPAEDGNQNATQHLDIHVDNLEAAVSWAETCGAVQATFQPQTFGSCAIRTVIHSVYSSADRDVDTILWLSHLSSKRGNERNLYGLGPFGRRSTCSVNLHSRNGYQGRVCDLSTINVCRWHNLCVAGVGMRLHAGIGQGEYHGNFSTEP